MQDYGFYIKRERIPEKNESLKNHVITDLPGKEPKEQPKDLPSPRHRPGEPILYEPPVENGSGRIAVMDPSYEPLSG